MSLPLALVAVIIGYMLIWLALDQQGHIMLSGIIGGVLFGGGIAAGLLGR